LASDHIVVTVERVAPNSLRGRIPQVGHPANLHPDSNGGEPMFALSTLNPTDCGLLETRVDFAGLVRRLSDTANRA
jgi:hypothetical protein